MRPIRQLSASVVNKIAAGEVIERPASVVKELLENSVDAGATQIELTLVDGGTELIRVTDNGGGIPEDQLQLAVSPHATSKIDDADDLFRVRTFGFRGEALASITEVSQALIRSRTAAQECGFELRVNGGQREEIHPCGAPVGTTIEIRQLFYNTPVRAKFLRSSQTERGHITEAFTRIALAHPEIQLTLIHNDKPIHQLFPTANWSERIDAFFGTEISDHLISVASHDQGVELHGFVVDPVVSRANNKLQYLFLNRRYIRDRSLQHALTEAYRGLLMTGRFPVCFLRMDMPFDLVDVNVHPAKLEVRFQNGGQLYSQLLGTIRNRFLTTDLTAHAQLSKRPIPEFRPFGSSDHFSNHPSTVRPGTDGADQDRAPSSKGAPFSLHSPALPHQTKLEFPNQPTQREWISGFPNVKASSHGRATSFQASNPLQMPGGSLTSLPLENSNLKTPADWDSQFPPTRQDAPHRAANQVSALQVHNTYIVQETDAGMVVIDQHALHERILYEQLRQKFQAGQLESQRMLVPEPVALPPAEAAILLQSSEMLAQFGVRVEPFGGDTVLVTAYPAILANQNPAEILGVVVDKLMQEGSTLSQQDLIDELLHMISCKAAIKAGDKLSAEEITALLEHRELCQDAHHCPHGRPTALVFSRDELDRRFKRI
jgi:DNA mismatch repair protein MutL